MRRNTFLILIFSIICLSVFYYNQDIFYKGKPCSKPIEFSIGDFDLRFNITKTDFINKINQAAQVWNTALGNNLFQYSPNGSLKINLIFDSRQEMTNELKQQGVDIGGDKASYDALDLKYQTLVNNYNSQSLIYKNNLAIFQSKQDDYNKLVDYWNKKGGATAKEYAVITSTKNSLKIDIENLNKSKNSLNILSGQINIMVSILNNLAERLNLKVSTFNTVRSSNGEEFSQGEYIVDDTGIYINIYEFENKTQLIRLLEHELGHALGLEHVELPQAIMYKLNSGENITLTTADISELNIVCNK